MIVRSLLRTMHTTMIARSNGPLVETIDARWFVLLVGASAHPSPLASIPC